MRCPRHTALGGGLGAVVLGDGGGVGEAAHLGLEPSPGLKAGEGHPSKVGCVCWRWVGDTFSDCAGPQLAGLCGYHVQEARVGAPGAQPRWVTAQRPRARGTGRVPL